MLNEHSSGGSPPNYVDTIPDQSDTQPSKLYPTIIGNKLIERIIDWFWFIYID